MGKKAIGYYRASTIYQHHTIGVQKELVNNYCNENGIELLSEFEECSSGDKLHQNRLIEALKLAEVERCSIICLCPDRLTREFSFGKEICENYDVIFCSNPNMGLSEKLEELYFAEREVKRIRERTKSVLRTLKRNGVKLGSPNAVITDEMRENSYKARKRIARENINNLNAYKEICENKELNLTELANHLNEKGFLSSRGCKFQAVTVKRIIELYKQ